MAGLTRTMAASNSISSTTSENESRSASCSHGAWFSPVPDSNAQLSVPRKGDVLYGGLVEGHSFRSRAQILLRRGIAVA
jgi:hypothetical protein